MKARLHCSRTRYEAIASGYYDSEFRELLGRDAATIEDYLAKRSAGWGTTEKLAKAFEARYPGIAVRVERTGAERVFQRVRTLSLKLPPQRGR